ncbi:MAG: Cd(II)/Pb(II)-responsive transcriptional regulator [Rubrivivax sp.]|nr:Cd(II)/Pb(II)-responsive transcriptional regulator [Rubrivivax sp.]
MKIGDLAAATDTSVESIRYYEREGLLPVPARTQGNYRAYDAAHVQRLQFIRRCRALDMTLDEVRALLQFIDTPQDDCAGVNALLDEHLGHVRHRIAELRRLEKELQQLRAQCASPRAADACGILRGLAQGGEARRPGADDGHHRHDDLHRPKARPAAR